MNTEPKNKKNARTIPAGAGAASKKGNLIFKIISVLAALAIWFFAYQYESPGYAKKFESVSVQLQGQDVMEENYGYSVIVGKSAAVDVTLTGKKSAVNKLKASDINAFVNLGNVNSPGETSLPVEVKEIAGVTVAEINPSYVNLYADKTVSANIPVNVDIKESAVEAGNTLEATLPSDGEYITLSGPEQEVKNVAKAQVDLYLGSEIIGKSLKIVKPVTLLNRSGQAVNTAGSNIRLDKTEVEVTVNVYTVKELPLVLNFKNNFFNSSNSKLTINPTSVTLKGAPDSLAGMDNIVLGTMDEKLTEENRVYTYDIKLPAGVTNISGVKTAEAQLEYVNLDKASFSLPAGRIAVTPPGGGLSYSLNITALQLNFIGPSAKLASLGEDNISAKIDLSKCTAPDGKYAAQVTVDVTGMSGVLCVGEYWVNANIFTAPQ